MRRRIGEQLIFIAGDTLYHANGEKNNAVVEYSATAQTNADGNEFCTIEREDTLLYLNANECRLGGSKQTWHERRKIIDNIKG